ncbi:MAG: chloride channel protein [Bacteroidales bacterium]|nr:chloride channel protein [Bacteroidales bacterium]MBR5735599.1 chloride channel protein [Bacteroidales bacterium]
MKAISEKRPKTILTNRRNIILRLAAALRNKISERNLLLLLSVLVGLGSGLAAVALKKIIELIQHLLFGGDGSGAHWWMYIVMPGVGMLLSMLLVKYVVRDKIGHGVTKVLLAISKNESHIRPHNMWSSLAASSLTIGFGGSVGAEAPIVYTGAAIGSNVARAFRMSYKNITILLGCGAAGAVAGIFKAPMAGILFTFEILLFNISMSSILPLLLSSVTATMVSYFVLGDMVTFSNSVEQFSMSNIPYYIILGVFCGLISLYFLRTTLKAEDMLRKVRKPYARWAICAASLGVLIFMFPPLFGEGYTSLTSMLNKDALVALEGGFIASFIQPDNEWAIVIFFAAVTMLKVLATAFTNAGGGVGGTFGPTLITGAFAGFVLARLVNILNIAAVPEENFVLVGMAGLMAGVMQAPLTAIFLIAEITGGYALLFPLIITSAISYATIRTTEQYSIYTKRIAASGELLTHDSDRAVLTLLKLSDFIETDFVPVRVDRTLGQLTDVIAHSSRNIFPVVDQQNHFLGIVYLDDVRQYMFRPEFYDKIYIYDILKESDSVTVSDRMETVMDKFETSRAWSLPVLDKNGIYLGFVSKSKIFSSYREQLQQVSHD